MSTVHLKNNAKGAFIIAGAGESLTGLVAPGNSIEIPASAADCDFVRNLIRTGELEVISASVIPGLDDDDNDEISDEKAMLIAEAEELGIAIDKRWGIAKLKEAIANA